MNSTLKRLYLSALTLTVVFGLAASARAVFIVNDTWSDGTRTDPWVTTYSEDGNDLDADGNIESAWFIDDSHGGRYGALPGHLNMTNGTSSTSFTTYFTPEGSEIVLNSPTDQLRVTWVFTPMGVINNNTSQGFTLGIVNSPSSARLTIDGNAPGTPTAGSYAGYGMFMNMGQTLQSPNSFQLRRFSSTGSDFLAHQGGWTGLATGAGSGGHGYDSGSLYTFVMSFTRNAVNTGNMDISATMSGGNIGGTGALSVNYTDTTPNSWTFDMFGIRTSSIASTASWFDSTRFSVEIIPEPSTLALMAAGLGLMAALIRRRR